MIIPRSDSSYNHAYVKAALRSLRTLPKADWAELEKSVPFLKKDKQLRCLAAYLATGPHQYDDATGYIRLGCNTIASVTGCDRKNTRTEDILKRYQEHVPSFGYRDYWFQGEKERAVSNTGVTNLMERFSKDYDPDRIYIDTLREASARKQQDVYRMLLEEVAKAHYSYPLQKKLASYLNALPMRHFTEPIALRFRDALDVARKLDEDAAKENKKTQHVALLYQFLDAPKPLYFPSQREHSKTPRLFGTGLTFLNKEIRHALFPHWIDLDLKNCQLAIVAALFNVESAQKLIESGESVWTHLMTQLEIPEAQQATAKKYIKIALYSLIYGKPVGLACMELYGALGFKPKISFARVALVEDVAKAISAAKESIKAKGGMQGAFGWMELNKTDIESFLACCMQTYELAIISAVYEVANQEKTFRNAPFDILLHQHDGVSILPRPGVRQNVVIDRLQRAVAAKAALFGISAKIQID